MPRIFADCKVLIPKLPNAYVKLQLIDFCDDLERSKSDFGGLFFRVRCDTSIGAVITVTDSTTIGELFAAYGTVSSRAASVESPAESVLFGAHNT